jgi:hypothetical protein
VDLFKTSFRTAHFELQELSENFPSEVKSKVCLRNFYVNEVSQKRPQWPFRMPSLKSIRNQIICQDQPALFPTIINKQKNSKQFKVGTNLLELRNKNQYCQNKKRKTVQVGTEFDENSPDLSFPTEEKVCISVFDVFLREIVRLSLKFSLFPFVYKFSDNFFGRFLYFSGSQKCR